MILIREFGERWARNAENIKGVPVHTEGGQGVYVLYDGSTPVYVGKGNIQKRLTKASNRNKRKGKYWDYFSWYILKDPDLIFDVEVLLLRILPPYLRHKNRQQGHFKDGHAIDQKPKDSTPIYIDRT